MPLHPINLFLEGIAARARWLLFTLLVLLPGVIWFLITDAIGNEAVNALRPTLPRVLELTIAYPVRASVITAAVIVTMMALLSYREVRVVAASWRHRPKVMPARYQAPPNPQTTLAEGLAIVNDGEPAFDVYLSNGMIGPTEIRFISGLNRFTKADGEHHCEVSVYRPDLRLESMDLFGEMREQQVKTFPVSVVYRDSEDHWYETTLILERNVTIPGGIYARYLSQKALRRKPDWVRL